jgi:hypothetical protein
MKQAWILGLAVLTTTLIMGCASKQTGMEKEVKASVAEAIVMPFVPIMAYQSCLVENGISMERFTEEIKLLKGETMTPSGIENGKFKVSLPSTASQQLRDTSDKCVSDLVASGF